MFAETATALEDTCAKVILLLKKKSFGFHSPFECESFQEDLLLSYDCYYYKWSLWSFDLLLLLLCVGVESPSHAIRADADPLARSATSIVITLADKYTYDCPVKILIYPSGRSQYGCPSN